MGGVWMSHYWHNNVHRKSQIFTIGVVLIVIAALVTSYFLITNKYLIKSDSKNLALGAKQLAVIQASQRAEATLMYLDVAVKYAVPQALIRLAKTGGFGTGNGVDPGENLGNPQYSECGAYIDPLWNAYATKTKCYPDQEVGFTNTLSATLDEYLLSNKQAIFTQDNYDYIIQQEADPPLLRIVGKAVDPISFTIITLGTPIAPVQQSAVQEPNSQLVEIGQGLCVSNIDCRLKQDTAQHLQDTIANLAAQGYTLTITSAHRDIAKQQQLYDACAPNCGGTVARPNPGAPHVVGGAIDIKVSKNGVLIDAGPSDAKYAYSLYASKFTDAQKANQKLIEKLMCDQGWVRYSDEWWHFEYGTTRWNKGQSAGACAI
jgi:D-alanyl-D-alanine dipeptidase